MPIDFEDGILLVDEDATPVADRILLTRNGLVCTVDDVNRLEGKYFAASCILNSGVVNSIFVEDLDIPFEGFVRKTGPRTFVSHQTNLTATTNPTVTNDDTEGYIPASIWINTLSGLVFMNVDNTTGAAVWSQLSNVAAVADNEAGLIIFDGEHSTNKTSYQTIARVVVDFDSLPSTTATFRWFQQAVPAGAASVRLRNITDGTNLFETTGLAVTGLQSASVTLPTGVKLLYFQHKEDSPGPGKSVVEGGTLHLVD